MTDDELLTMGYRFLEKWQPRVHLMDWDIVVQVAGDVPTDRSAEVDIDWRHRKVAIRLPLDMAKRTRDSCHAWRNATDAEIVEWAILHECWHVAEQPMADQFRDDLDGWVGADSIAGSETRTRYRDYREWWINQAVRVLLEADRGAWRA